MREGAILLVKHINQKSKVFVQIDEDCDGYTSAAVLINYLNLIAPNFVQNNLVYKTHDRKEHGIVVEAVPPDTKLVIIPDAGSSQLLEHSLLADAGMDVLILDHHNAHPYTPDACLINNQTCDYPNKGLSGVGIVYKFCCYLDSLLGVQYAPQFLDLVAVGMIADMMPLNNYETRYMVSEGLNHINNAFLNGMVMKNEFYLKGKLTPHGVSFCIAPAVNAIARVGTKEERKLLFESMLDFCAYDMIPSTKRGCSGQMETKVEQSCRNCTNIRNRQNKDRDYSIETADKQIDKLQLLSCPVLIIRFDEQPVNENLTGLIANQLAAKYNRPTLVLNLVREIKNDEELFFWRGSGRNIKGTKFMNFQKFLLDSGLVEYAAGHDNALGVSIPYDNIDNFIEYCEKNLNWEDFNPIYHVDLVFEASLVNGVDILELGDLSEIWGEGVEEPTVLVRNLHIHASNIEFLKGKAIKITPANRDDNLSDIMFTTDETIYEGLRAEYGLVTIDLVGTCARNAYNGQPQIIIQDFEIVKKQAYYF